MFFYLKYILQCTTNQENWLTKTIYIDSLQVVQDLVKRRSISEGLQPTLLHNLREYWVTVYGYWQDFVLVSDHRDHLQRRMTGERGLKNILS